MNKIIVQILCLSFATFYSLSGIAQNQNDPLKVDKKELEKVTDVPPPPPPPPPPPSTKTGMYNPIEVMPRFPACEDENLAKRELENCSKERMLKYIYKNLVYPEQAKKKGIEGMAVVQFYIDKDGSIKNLKLVRDVPEGCGRAALEVMKKMQSEYKWIPGSQGGKIVKVQYTLPIKFKL